MKNNIKREYPCPKCGIGELHDVGAMFIAQIRCTNPDCDYKHDDSTGCISGDITD